MIDTFMALWNRSYHQGKRALFTFFAFLLICISISLLVVTAGHFWSRGERSSVGQIEVVPTTDGAVTIITATPTTTIIQNCLPSPTQTVSEVVTSSNLHTPVAGQGKQPAPAPTPAPQHGPLPTPTPVATQTPGSTPTVVATQPPTVTPTPTVVSPTSTPTVVPTTPTPAPLPSPTPTITPLPQPTPTLTATVAPTSTVMGTTTTATPTLTPSPDPTPTLVEVSPTSSATVDGTATVQIGPQSAFSGGGGGTPNTVQETPTASSGWVTSCGSDALISSGLMSEGAILLDYLLLLVAVVLLGTLLFYVLMCVLA